MNDRVMLVDGTNLLVRAERASERTPMSVTLSDGVQVRTGPLLLFINQLSRAVMSYRPDRLVVCWDKGRSSFRTAIFDGYKGHRPESSISEDPYSAFSLASEFLWHSSIPQARTEGVEADDLIAAYWRLHRTDADVYVISGDKDFLQLVEALSDGSKVVTQTSQVRVGADTELWDLKHFETEMGFSPDKYVLVRALTGDPSDGIPGVPRVGVKTAVKILEGVGWTLTGLLDLNTGPVAGHTDTVWRNYRLMSLRDSWLELPPVLPVPEFAPNFVSQFLIDWLTKFRMSSVIERLDGGSLWGLANQS